MKKSLKSKFKFIYLCLILTIAIIGIVSVMNFSSLSDSIDTLLTHNYKSINASNMMIHSIDKQNSSLFYYIHSQKQEAIDDFYKNKSIFDKYYKIEDNNQTEKGEKELTEKVNINYAKFLISFSKIQEINSSQGMVISINYYNQNVLPLLNKITSDLASLSSINENAMYENRDLLSSRAQTYKYIIFIISIIAVIGGILFSSYFINRFLFPICELTETIKSVGQGHLRKEAMFTSEDEIGDLAKEFNKMTLRLEEYEQSTMGKFLTEKNKFSAIIKTLADPLIVLDKDQKIVLLNNSCQDFFQMKEETVLNEYFIDVMDNSDLYHHISNVLNDKEENKAKIILFKSQSSDYYFNVITTIIKDNSSSITGIVVLFQNITQLKQLEKIKADFISTISHEFKTPLTSIMMGASLIEDENIGELNNQQHKIIDTIKEDGERLSELVTNLLQLSRIEWSKSIFNMRTCSILGIVEQSIKGFYAQATTKDINLFIDVDEHLPKIFADPEKINWVLNNLLSNALKYTNAGDELSVSAKVCHGKMIICVKDTGAGIPKEYIEKIFDQFVQVKGYDSEVRGTGLGLTIAKEIVEAHNGEIWCESHLDVGSSFTFTLPLKEKE